MNNLIYRVHIKEWGQDSDYMNGNWQAEVSLAILLDIVGT